MFQINERFQSQALNLLIVGKKRVRSNALNFVRYFAENNFLSKIECSEPFKLFFFLMSKLKAQVAAVRPVRTICHLGLKIVLISSDKQDKSN